MKKPKNIRNYNRIIINSVIKDKLSPSEYSNQKYIDNKKRKRENQSVGSDIISDSYDNNKVGIVTDEISDDVVGYL